MRQLIRATALGFALSSLLVGCGGGGSGSNGSSNPSSSLTVSGIAGAPVAGGQVIIEDATSKQVRASLDANGKATVDVSSLKAPYLIQVTGNVNGSAVQYVSLANTTDIGKTISVSPLTDLAVAEAAGTTTQTLFTTPAPLTTVATNLPAQASQVAKMVVNVLGQIDLNESDSTKIDVFHYDPTVSGGFHTKLDGLLDVLTIAPQPNSNNITVTYKADPTVTVTLDETSSTNTNVQLAAPNVDAGTVANTLVAIQNQITAFQNKFASSVPAQTDLSGIFDTTGFLDSGLNFSDFYSSTLQQAVGIKVSNISIAKWVDPQHVWIRFTITKSNGLKTDPMGWEVSNVGGTWLLEGNQQIGVDLSIKSEAVTDGNSYATGIRFGVIPNQNTTSGQQINHAIITGPGLPASGITLSAVAGQSWLGYTGASSDNLMVMDGCANTAASGYYCSGDITAVQDNSTYNVQLFDGNNNPLNGTGYDVYLGKAPLSVTDAASTRAASFAVFNNPTVSATSVTVSWKLPSWMYTESDNVYVSGPNASGGTNGSNFINDDLATTATSTNNAISNMGLTGSPNHLTESVVLRDATGLRFRTTAQWNSL